MTSYPEHPQTGRLPSGGIECALLDWLPAPEYRRHPGKLSAPASDTHGERDCGPLPSEDEMKTTRLRMPRTLADACGEVLHECFAVTPPRGDGRPREQDAVKIGVMRRITAARLRQCGLQVLADDVMLIVSELLTNALLHSGASRISLRVTVESSVLRVTVCDGMPGAAEPRAAGADDECGRGLALVAALVEETGGSWGTSQDGAQTWCCLVLPEAGRS